MSPSLFFPETKGALAVIGPTHSLHTLWTSDTKRVATGMIRSQILTFTPSRQRSSSFNTSTSSTSPLFSVDFVLSSTPLVVTVLGARSRRECSSTCLQWGDSWSDRTRSSSSREEVPIAFSVYPDADRDCDGTNQTSAR